MCHLLFHEKVINFKILNKQLNSQTDVHFLRFGLKKALYYFSTNVFFTSMCEYMQLSIKSVGLDISEGNPHPHSHFDFKYLWVLSLFALSKGVVHSTQHS